MSYDVYLEGEPCVTCGHKPEGPEGLHPTYNLTPIFDLALTNEPLPNADVSEMRVVLLKEETDRPRGLRILNGRKAADTVKPIEEALRRLEDPTRRAEFAALEPPNRWGTVQGAIQFLRYMLEYAQKFPERVWHIQ